MKYQRKIKTKIGPLYLVASDNYLYVVSWTAEKIEFSESAKASKIMDQTEKQVHEYFTGTRTSFNLPLKMEGTDFQKRVWNELKKIPYGETRSYKQIATLLNDPHASRAVGTANGKNPITLIVPCHRVIASNGTIGGYTGGLKIKEHLLNLENSAKF